MELAELRGVRYVLCEAPPAMRMDSDTSWQHFFLDADVRRRLGLIELN